MPTGEMTFLSGAICTLDGKPFCEVTGVQELDIQPEDPLEDVREDIAAKLELPEGIVFECNSFKLDYNPWLAELLGIPRKKKRAWPSRKRQRLLTRLKNRYGWLRTAEYSLTPCGDGTFKCVCDAGTLSVDFT